MLFKIILVIATFCSRFAHANIETNHGDSVETNLDAMISLPEFGDYTIDASSKLFSLVDTSNNIQVSDLEKTGVFQLSKTSFGVSPHPIWLKLHVVNPSQNSKNVRLWLKDGFIYDAIDVFAQSLHHSIQHLGSIHGEDDFSQRMHRTKDLVIPFHIAANENLTLYIKIQNRASIQFTPIICSAAAYEYASRDSYVFYGFFFGAILITLISYLLLFIRTGDRSLFYYPLYLLGLSALFLTISGLGPEYIWTGRFQAISLDFSSPFCGITLLLFMRNFLQTKTRAPILDRILRIFIAIMFVLIVLSFFKIRNFILAQSIFAIYVALIILAIASVGIALKRRFPSARPFALAWAFFYLGAILSVLTAMGVTQRGFISQYGMQVGVMIQMVFLSLASAERMAEAQKEIIRLNEKRQGELEAEIELRTRAMREIIDNVKGGFFLINRDTIVQPGFTNSCRKIIGSHFREGIYLETALPCSEKEFGALRVAVDQVFDDMMPPKVTLALIPNRIHLGSATLSIEGSVIRNSQGKIEKILFSIADVSDLAAAEAQKKIDDSLIGILRQRNSFLRFLSDFRMMIRQLKKLCGKTDQSQARQLLHTIKGNAGIFNLDQLVTTVHAVEDLERIEVQNITDIENTMKDFMTSFMQSLGISYQTSSDESCQIDRSRVAEFRMRIRMTTQADELRTLALEFASDLCHKPAKELLSPLVNMAQNLGGKIDKKIEVIIEDHDCQVDPVLFAPILQILPHLVRNSATHGIELPEERIKAGKTASGIIKISVTEEADAWKIVICDDGRGLDPNLIAETAVQKNLVQKEQVQHMTDAAKQWLIFTPSFTTATEVTTISGRGIGMDAVLASVKNCGATLELDSIPGKETSFTIRMPKLI